LGRRHHLNSVTARVRISGDRAGCFSRKAIGWELGRTLETGLPLAALEAALACRRPQPRLVHHSDRGTQYASNEYVKRLEACGAHLSMSRPARPWENGKGESFIKTLKREEIDARRYASSSSCGNMWANLSSRSTTKSPALGSRLSLAGGVRAIAGVPGEVVTRSFEFFKA
jgi:transposase InsO family protein